MIKKEAFLGLLEVFDVSLEEDLETYYDGENVIYELFLEHLSYQDG